MKKFIAVALALSLMGAVGCTKSKEADSEASVTATAVAATPAKKGAVTSTMSFDGNLRAQSEVIITIPQPGKVISTNVGVGSTVKKGQLLFSMDSSAVSSQKGTTKAQYDAAKASADYTNNMLSDSKKQLSDAKANKKQLETQLKSLEDPIIAALNGNPYQASISSKLKSGMYAQAALELKNITMANPAIANPLFDNLDALSTANEQLGAAIGQLESSIKTLEGQKIQLDGQIDIAKAGIKAIDAQISNYKVYAPISGIIGTYDITVGSYPTSQIPMTIVDMDKVTLSVNMLDTQVGKVKVGDTVTVTVEALNNRKVEGKIKTVAPAPDLQTRMYPVIVEIDNPAHEIKPGFFVKASFATDSKSDVLYIPSAAILKNDDGTSYVYVNANGTAKKTNVSTGIEDAEGNIEVTGGINEGDLVITSNLSSLRDGAPVFSLEEKED